jgi:peptide/nickel transport system substrate-binding protein
MKMRCFDLRWVAMPLIFAALTAPTIAIAADGSLKPGGTLRLAALASDVDSLDPKTAYTTDAWEVLRATTRQLVTYAGSPANLVDDTKIVPDLAQSWEVSADGKTYTFHLRPGVTYSGSTHRPIVAKDFVYAIKRFCDPNSRVAAIGYFNLSISGFASYCKDFSKVPTGDLAASRSFADTHDIAGVTAADDNTLILRSDSKNYDFLNILAMPFVTPLPEEVVSRYVADSADLRKNFPSSGPYYIDSYASGQKLILKKVANYNSALDPARKAYVDEIEIDFSTNSEDAVVQKIQAGDADLSLYLDVPPLATIRRYQALKSPFMHASNMGAADFMVINAQPQAMNSGTVALRKLAVRQALAYAVNKAHLVQAQGGPIAALPLGQIITSTQLGHRPFDPYATPGSRGDASKAKSLLAQAGFPNGISFDLVYQQTAHFATIAVTLKEDLASSGITVNLVPLPLIGFTAYLRDPKSRFDLALGQFFPDWQGPSTRMLLGGWLDSDAAPCGKGNVLSICYSNPAANALATKAFASDNPEPIWAEADRLVSTDLPWIPLFESRRIAVTSDRLKNWVWSSLATQADITNIAVNQ